MTLSAERRAAGCETLEEVEGFIAAAIARGDDETRAAGEWRRLEILKATSKPVKRRRWK